MRNVVWLDEAAVGRDNNVRLLRHLAALAVILFHCFALNARWTDDPLARITSRPVDLGSLGVQIFFALSGFLVAQSWCQHPSARAFVEARMLRIYPALVAATLFTIALAAPTSSLSLHAYLADPQTREYLWKTALGLPSGLPLPDVFRTNPYPGAANGSLWTLPIEIKLYMGILLVGLLGILDRLRVALILASLVVVLLVYVPGPVSLFINAVVIRSLCIIFVCGALAYVWRLRIPLSIALAALLLVIYLTLPPGFVRAVATLPMIAYITLVAAYHPRLRVERFVHGPDLSYGLYVYAFPVQQLALWRWPALGAYGLFFVATPAIFGAAALSWYGIERPAMRLKNRLQRHSKASYQRLRSESR
jgi:peptidoglycan/LPS O-acetylase OafA/YrhL